MLDDANTLHIPVLFWFEISNLLTSAVKRKRIKLSDAHSLLKLVPQSKFNTDFSFGSDYANNVIVLADKYELSSYDATYLELAIRKTAVLGTLDNNLSKACIKAGVQLI
jgi:predicted nucleic acid-binding protein